MTGVVQGVGFRPTLYRLACEAGLGGSIQNRTGSIQLVLEGEAPTVNTFLASLPESLPANARLDDMTILSEEPLAAGSPLKFLILESNDADSPGVVFPADLAICPDCARELFDPANRRYGYPFTTCTRCGPRYTVVTAMPYDRERTTMKRFPLCPACRSEYTTPSDRRFHAESIACPDCGPSVWFENAHGTRITGDPLRLAREALARGEIIAIRGIGGFHLAANALNRDTITRLRQHKARPGKPFAVMARNLAVIQRLCDVPEPASAALMSPASPIVILDVLPTTGYLHLDLISPDTQTLGIMLPSSPLHHLLMSPLAGDEYPAFDLLVMTSGNWRGEPICISNEEARGRLAGIADGLLMHDREITLRNDDSVCVIRADKLQLWRRARGYAPAPIALTTPLRRCVLAMGADMKNAIALGAGNQVILSPHVGDLDTVEACDGLAQAARTLPAFLHRDPDVIAVDAHPDMQSRRQGESLARSLGLPVIEVQHHHAHAVACLAEHGLTEGVVLVMDGTGWGQDGTIWGAECLEIRDGTFRRHATFVPVPLPGGDAAVRHPARQVVSRWFQAGIPPDDARFRALGVNMEEAALWIQQCKQGFNAPLTHSAGRLLDAFATVLGITPRDITYEGQPAIRLETDARAWTGGTLPELPFATVERDGLLMIDWAPAFRRLADTAMAVDTPHSLAMAVHVAVARAAWVMLSYTLSRTSDRTAGLSGGVFMNHILTEYLTGIMGKNRIAPLLHHVVPPGDGGIALGQVLVAGSR